MRKRVSFGSLPIGAEFQRANNGSWWRKVKPSKVLGFIGDREMTINCETCGPRGQITAGEIDDSTLVWVKEE